MPPTLPGAGDPDGSGVLELRELNKLLRRGGEVQLDAKMQAGAAGEIKVKAENKSALRKGVSLKQLGKPPPLLADAPGSPDPLSGL